MNKKRTFQKSFSDTPSALASNQLIATHGLNGTGVVCHHTPQDYFSKVWCKCQVKNLKIYFKCRECPDFRAIIGGGVECHYNPEKPLRDEKTNPDEDIPDWCPRFPL